MSMIQCQFTTNNPKGVHSRVAKEIARIAGEYNSTIRILHDGEAADAISILEVLSLGISCGVSFSVQIEGKQAEESRDALSLLFEKTEDP